MNNQITLETAIRTVGQLILHHPTTGRLARNNLSMGTDPTDSEACQFCYIGAAYLVASSLLNDPDYGDRLSRECDNVIGRMISGPSWDNASDSQRTEWANKLANYKENV